jgi:Sigma-70, region 4
MDELHLGSYTRGRLREAGITTLDEVTHMTGRELVERIGPEATYELACVLAAHDLAFAKIAGGEWWHIPNVRNLEILRLRIVEGLTYKATGEAVGLSKERIRQILRTYFGA